MVSLIPSFITYPFQGQMIGAQVRCHVHAEDYSSEFNRYSKRLQLKHLFTKQEERIHCKLHYKALNTGDDQKNRIDQRAHWIKDNLHILEDIVHSLLHLPK
jgi:hypothetical protein